MTSIGEFVNNSLYTYLYIQLTHWTTRSYALHKATCGFLGTWQTLTDQMIETWIGNYDQSARSELQKSQFHFKANALQPKQSVRNQLSDIRQFLINFDVPNTDMMNIRDEMLAEINKLFYLSDLQ